MGKGMGGGMPVGFTAATAMMDLLSDNQNWAYHHFGGHPVIASACLATCRKLLKQT
jgi:4-aminobutyrate aminotransferase-like enzyme